MEMSQRLPVTPFVSLTAFPAAVSVKDIILSGLELRNVIVDFVHGVDDIVHIGF